MELKNLFYVHEYIDYFDKENWKRSSKIFLDFENKESTSALHSEAINNILYISLFIFNKIFNLVV